MTTKIDKNNIDVIENKFVNWQPVVTADGFTATSAVSGQGYFIDTTSNAHTINLPSSPELGDTIKISDYAGTFDSNNVTINATGGLTIEGASSYSLIKFGQSIAFFYDGQKWKRLENTELSSFITATGGTVTESGDYKIHTFTGDGCFVVSSGEGNVDYLVVAGGGSGGAGGTGAGGGGGGGGAGGFRESSGTASGCYTVSPLGVDVGALPVSATTYPITVGSGGTGVSTADTPGNNGSPSIFSTITSAGGGGGGGGPIACSANPYRPGLNGGSGGGAGGGVNTTPANLAPGGSGNTPPVSPPQGQPGGSTGPCAALRGASGGGGATAAGANSVPTATPGGAGAGTLINPATGVPGPACLQYYAGGGGAGAGLSQLSPGGIGGGGTGGTNNSVQATVGTVNTGGGGGGGGDNCSPILDGAAGGSGIVIIRYKYQ